LGKGGSTVGIDTRDVRYRDENLEDYRVGNAIFYLRFARRALKAGDVEHACLGYRLALETWQEVNQTGTNDWEAEQVLTNREYASFLLGEVEAGRHPDDVLPALVPGHPVESPRLRGIEEEAFGGQRRDADLAHVERR
jgi:hypothetical protein